LNQLIRIPILGKRNSLHTGERQHPGRQYCSRDHRFEEAKAGLSCRPAPERFIVSSSVHHH
jgi:hypothetical protein